MIYYDCSVLVLFYYLLSSHAGCYVWYCSLNDSGKIRKPTGIIFSLCVIDIWKLDDVPEIINDCIFDLGGFYMWYFSYIKLFFYIA